MERVSPTQKNRRLRQLLHRDGIVRTFAPHDVFSALVLERAGVEMLFLGGFGVSASVLGLPDVGLTSLTEMTEAVRRLCDRLTVPVIADADTGFGGPASVARTVRSYESAGASGLLLEDQEFPKRCGHFSGKSVIPAAHMHDKLKRALDTRVDEEFVIVARTDARAEEGLGSAIDRASSYADLGADMVFVEAPESTDELRQIGREIDKPQLANMLPGGKTPIHSAGELQDMGFQVVVDPIATLLATAKAVQKLASQMLGAGEIDASDLKMITLDEAKDILGYSDFVD